MGVAKVQSGAKLAAKPVAVRINIAKEKKAEKASVKKLKKKLKKADKKKQKKLKKKLNKEMHPTGPKAVIEDSEVLKQLPRAALKDMDPDLVKRLTQEVK